MKRIIRSLDLVMERIVTQVYIFQFIFIRIKKDEGQGKEKCHAKSMMSKETNERLKRDTRHVPLRQKRRKKYEGRG